MRHGSTARRGQRVFLSLLTAGCLVAASPAGIANAGAPQKPVGATHGDCKNDNAGKHLGFVCPLSIPGIDTGTGGDTGLVIDT